MATEIRVPALGESVTEATIARWLKKEGENVAADEPLVELETDKVSVEVPAPSTGVLSKISAKEGDTVEVDAVLGMIGEAAAKAARKEKSAGKDEKAPAGEGRSKAGAKKQAVAGRTVEVRVPQSGESVTEAEVGEWLKKEGDRVEADEPIVSLETDKASMEVPAPAAGIIRKIAAKEGETVEVGALLAEIEAGGDGAAAKEEPALRAAAERAAPAPSAGKPLSPAPRRIIGEYALDPAAVEGTGKDGRITKADALAAAKAKDGAKARAPEPAPAPARETGPREERVKMSRLRQTIARRLKEAQQTAAMLTTFNDVDMSAVMALRGEYKELFEKKHGVKLGFMSFFVKACVHALKEIPEVNAEIDGTDIIYKNHYDIGVAVGTDRGLVVPVVRDADAKSLAAIEAEIADFGRRARDGSLKLEEMQGGTFTISNGGVYGSLLSTPILNAPQSGILGMHRIEERPVARDGQVVVRPMMYLALSYDHRIVDGKGAVTFLVRVKENLEDPQRLLLDL
ncbi:2-oxoglutarate dehydrogenase complex dihydrolipoyllysine-residue succinyltransferase [Amphiplicatus metriothermophilus]|uniref:Dihydrolipoyllysine-residue succinyltransferase component of 2-oxoglutarate dehydrogenase complex n=1 Tax=Amphiplicatus metriothermophilus TaxID=1519374 RepID=A0A239PKF4_9PROT|nr:2-oxoglutarate dehydrogenase complex dihydrolipoyllysine-residue succinyltransferase [Amphiplicatus metriothermophilus]MBB5517362.1 2-oxoglutarate dehydrogenase E2 component (dihydrolipoamide succinyltransferase) [Amphiplicatus metriothermophilus]SNT68302.1 2-oxoglutarate dehydrogenase E2 component [Amphiplicatus metriothermophilus]